MRHILRCRSCKRYTLSEVCQCGGEAAENKPPKYSPEDKYAAYRRKVKEPQWKEEGLI